MDPHYEPWLKVHQNQKHFVVRSVLRQGHPRSTVSKALRPEDVFKIISAFDSQYIRLQL